MIDTINYLSYQGNFLRLVPPMAQEDLEVILDKEIEPEVLTPTPDQRNRLRSQILGHMRRLAENVFTVNNPRLSRMERSVDCKKRVSQQMEVYFYGERPASFKPGVADMSLFKQFLDDPTMDYIYRQLKTCSKGASLKQIAFNVLSNAYYNRYS